MSDEQAPPKQQTHPCANCRAHVVLMPAITTGRSATDGVKVLRDPQWMHLEEGGGFASAYLFCRTDKVATP